jgi:hypothetical protein
MVVSAHSFDSVLLCFWKMIEKFGFELGFDMSAKVTLGGKEMLGPMGDALGRGNAEGEVGFIANLLWRTRCGNRKVPRLVKEVNRWLDHSSESLRKRIVEPGKIDWVGM